MAGAGGMGGGAGMANVYAGSGMMLAGGLMDLWGTLKAAKEAKKRQAKIEDIAATPGLDVGAVTSEALDTQSRFLPQAERLARTEALDRQSLVNDLLEQSMPGFSSASEQAMRTNRSLLAGELPPEIAAAIQQSAAARSLGGGWGGSGMARNLVARDFGLTSLGLQNLGLNRLQLQRNLFPTVSPVSALSLAGPNYAQLAAIRGGERADRMNWLASAAGLPTSNEVIGGRLQDVGSAVWGTGAGMLGGSGQGFGSSNSNDQLNDLLQSILNNRGSSGGGVKFDELTGYGVG